MIDLERHSVVDTEFSPNDLKHLMEFGSELETKYGQLCDLWLGKDGLYASYFIDEYDCNTRMLFVKIDLSLLSVLVLSSKENFVYFVDYLGNNSDVIVYAISKEKIPNDYLTMISEYNSNHCNDEIIVHISKSFNE